MLATAAIETAPNIPRLSVKDLNGARGVDLPDPVKEPTVWVSETSPFPTLSGRAEHPPSNRAPHRRTPVGHEQFTDSRAYWGAEALSRSSRR